MAPTSCEEVGGHIVCTVDYRINSDQISSRSTSRLIGYPPGYGTGVHRRHPGIIAANAHLCGKDAQEHVYFGFGSSSWC